MKLRGTGSPYLWALKRKSEIIRDMYADMELLKELESYERGVCISCIKLYCGDKDLEKCYEDFLEIEMTEKKGDE